MTRSASPSASPSASAARPAQLACQPNYTRAQALLVPLKGNNELLSLTQPHVVRKTHEAYLAAGSDIVETNTFGATAVGQAGYSLAPLAREMNVQAAALARQACERCSTPEYPRFVAWRHRPHAAHGKHQPRCQ